MNHAIETAVSGRAKCRGCGRNIAKDELRLGERLPNPYADEGNMVLWFHLSCGAFKRPEVLLEALQRTTTEVEDRQRLSETAQLGIAHRRLTRVDGVQRSPTGRARCRSCRSPSPRTPGALPLSTTRTAASTPAASRTWLVRKGISAQRTSSTD